MKSLFARLKGRLKRYFSGRLAIVQIVAGVGAFAGRSLIAYATRDMGTTVIVLSSMLGSYVGYVALWATGYWLFFRRDYRESGRHMPLDIIRLQFVEQMPNIGTFAASGLTQGALIGGAGMEPVLATNLASWFGPHKILNFIAMAATNTLKKGWIDGSWSPRSALRTSFRRAKGLSRRVLPVLGDEKGSVSMTTLDHHAGNVSTPEAVQPPEPVAPR